MGFSIGGFFRDIVAPVALAFIPKVGPYLAATYSGINTGIKTGSPLAGLGSAGLSLGLSSAFKNLTAAASTGATTVGTKASEIAGSTFEGALKAPEAFGGAISGTTGGIGNLGGGPGFMTFGSDTFKGALEQGSTSLVDRVGATFGDIGANIATGVKNLNPLSETATLVGGLPEGGITDAIPDFLGRQSPGTIALGGLALKTMATPPPAPAPFAPMQGQPARDFSKYSYKGPLNRGAYTYADPEDIAYGRVDPDTYGYLGAKEGGTINLADGGGVMMQKGPYNLAIEKTKGTFRPTGSMVAPEAGPGIAQLAQLQPMMSINPQKIAGLAQPVAPTVPTNLPIQAAAQPKAPMPMPQPNQQQDASKQAMELISRLPKKDLNVDLGQVASALGFSFNEGGTVPSPEDLPEKEFASVGIYRKPTEYKDKQMASGGEVPGMAKQALAGIKGQSSNVGSGTHSSNPGILNQEDFVAEWMRVMPGSFSKFGSYLANPQIGKTIYQQYKNYDQPKKEMAEGGEVNSNQTLQENAFVIPADVVGHIGDGSSDAGAQRLQSFLGMNPQRYQAGGIMAGQLNGPGGGLDDLIQTSIEGKRAAAVSPEEFVVPRDIVAEIGRGSYDKGSNKLYALMRNVRQQKTGTTKQPAELTRGLGQLMRTAVA